MPAKNVAVVGLQWGDEGKGKIVDALAPLCRYVARYCGGANAGHTVKKGDEKYALHLIPSGILHAGVINVIGNGVAFDPAVAMEEIVALRDRNVAVGPENFRISTAAQLVMPWHKLQDTLSEKALAGDKIGTTARGIGPCYADKALRSTAIRAAEMADLDGFAEMIRSVGAGKSRMLTALYDAEPLDLEAIVAEYVPLAEQMAPMLCNAGAMLRRAGRDGERVMFEGGQGSMLDIDHGTFPFVTSSSVTGCGISPGTGIPAADVGDIIGVLKAYTSRVGAGPFPTEQDNAIGDGLRERGHEYGTTTGRPRRCGWLDAVSARYAADLSGITEIALSLLDVLSGMDDVKICSAYTIDGQAVDDPDPTELARVECSYETLSGWNEDITACRSFDELPAAAQNYVRRVEELVGRPVGIVSVGPDRSQSLLHNTRIEGLS